jgi:hypothetical protein
MSDAVDLADVPQVFERWLAGRPLADRSRREYARNVRVYCIWLATTSDRDGWQGDPLTDPLARDHAARDFRRLCRSCPPVSQRVRHRRQGDPMRAIGLDVHRDWCDVAIYEDGEVRSVGRVATTPDQLALFAQSLAPDDRVALETTGNALSIARIIEPHVAAVLVADTRNVRAMTHAKVKNDRVDARMHAVLAAPALSPTRGLLISWMPTLKVPWPRLSIERMPECPPRARAMTGALDPALHHWILGTVSWWRALRLCQLTDPNAVL